MPVFVTQGRYTHDAIKGMVAKPEDRAEAVSKLCEQAGGKMLSYYVTLGEYDFLVVSEMPSAKEVSAVVITAAVGGGVTHLRTMQAMTTAEAKDAFAAAGGLAASFRPAGAS